MSLSAQEQVLRAAKIIDACFMRAEIENKGGNHGIASRLADPIIMAAIIQVDAVERNTIALARIEAALDRATGES